MNKSVFYSTLFGIGKVPFAPGTFGSIAAFLVYLLLPKSWFFSTGNQFIFFLIVFFFTIISVKIVSKAEEKLGHDHKSIVIDEFFGYFITVSLFSKSLLVGLLGLLFFRIFDILKPEPVDKLQNLPKGWGVMFDDFAAGLYANLLLHILLYGFKLLNVI